ncbi:UNVERIFIED_CONTAM: hypothetical protein K2H54_032037 [Gekko kuhli]
MESHNNKTKRLVTEHTAQAKPKSPLSQPRAGSEPPAKKAKKKKAPKERSSPPSRLKPVDTGSEASASTRRHRSPSVRNRHVGTDKPSTSRGRSPHRGSTPPSAPSRHRSPSAPRLRSEPSPSLEIFRQDRSSSPDVLLLEPESPPAFDPLDMPPPWYPCHCSKSLPSNRGRNRSPSPLSVRGDLLHRHVDDLDRSLSLLEGQSEEDSEPRSVPSPEEVIGAATSVSPSEDMSSFADQITRMAKALDIKHAPSEPRTKDPLMQPLFSPDTGPVALPCLQGLQEVMFAAWQHPASAPPSGRRLEALYKIIDSDCGFLFRHPPPNSFISEHRPRYWPRPSQRSSYSRPFRYSDRFGQSTQFQSQPRQPYQAPYQHRRQKQKGVTGGRNQRDQGPRGADAQ